MRLSKKRQKQLDQIRRYFWEGGPDHERELMRQLAAEKIPEAVYLSACKIEATEGMKGRIRHINELKEAARLGHPDAIYHLGMYYDVGDELPKNTLRAARLFEKAAAMGHARSMWICALDLLTGNGHVPENINRGMRYLDKACAAGFDEALETKSIIYRDGLYGIEKNPSLAAHYMELAESSRA